MVNVEAPDEAASFGQKGSLVLIVEGTQTLAVGADAQAREEFTNVPSRSPRGRFLPVLGILIPLHRCIHLPLFRLRESSWDLAPDFSVLRTDFNVNLTLPNNPRGKNTFPGLTSCEHSFPENKVMEVPGWKNMQDSSGEPQGS